MAPVSAVRTPPSGFRAFGRLRSHISGTSSGKGARMQIHRQLRAALEPLRAALLDRGIRGFQIYVNHKSVGLLEPAPTEQGRVAGGPLWYLDTEIERAQTPDAKNWRIPAAKSWLSSPDAMWLTGPVPKGLGRLTGQEPHECLAVVPMRRSSPARESRAPVGLLIAR